jgi:hypothetical protein
MYDTGLELPSRRFSSGRTRRCGRRRGYHPSDLLNQAVRELLYRLRCVRDAERYALHPLTAAETAIWPNEAWPDEDTDWTEVFGQ